MCRVYITTVFVVIIKTPIIPIFCPKLIEIVDIRTFTVNHLPKESLLYHIKGCNLKVIVHTIFEHHTVAACFFTRINKRPNLIHIKRCRHFYSHVFAVLHCVECHWGVVLPVGYYINKINIRAFTKGFPSIFTARVLRHTWVTCFFNYLLGFFHHLRTDITKGGDFSPLNVHIAFHGTITAHSQTDNPHTYCV